MIKRDIENNGVIMKKLLIALSSIVLLTSCTNYGYMNKGNITYHSPVKPTNSDVLFVQTDHPYLDDYQASNTEVAPLGGGNPSATYVHGYTKADGTYVAPHYRSSADSTTKNNWSTKGNVNPYTGKMGGRK